MTMSGVSHPRRGGLRMMSRRIESDVRNANAFMQKSQSGFKPQLLVQFDLYFEFNA